MQQLSAWALQKGKNMKLYIIDAFTSATFGGNPAGVVLIDEGNDFPSDDTMLKTAAELRYSETAFIKKIDDKTFQTRYFTPLNEVDLCGHATVAAFWALKDMNLIESEKSYKNITLAGELDVSIVNDCVLMDMAPPHDIKTINDLDALKRLYASLGLEYKEFILAGSLGNKLTMLPKIISTGLPDIIIPVQEAAILKGLTPDFHEIKKISDEYNVTGYHTFALACSDDDEETAITRNFAPSVGIDEEAATGTASGALAHYLNSYGLIENNTQLSFLQGESLGRPSRIQCTLVIENGNEKIRVGGSGSILARGEIFI